MYSPQEKFLIFKLKKKILCLDSITICECGHEIFIEFENRFRRARKSYAHPYASLGGRNFESVFLETLLNPLFITCYSETTRQINFIF